MASAFSAEQMAQYCEYVGLPARYHVSALPELNPELLDILHSYQLAKVPYENLSIHYSRSHRNSLDPQELFQKIVRDARGRGGYCMETSIFYHHILRAYGFKVYMTGVRIRMREDGVPVGDYIGLVHIVNIVTFSDGSKYMVDVAFGGDGAIHPIPLIDGHVVQNLGSQQIRLIYDSIPQFISGQRMWIYQYRNGEDKPWNSYYCFREAEYLHQDFEIMNFWTSTCPESFQTMTTLVVKFVMGEVEESKDATGKIVGKYMLAGPQVKANMGGKTSLIKTCQNEEERVSILADSFKIILTPEEAASIIGSRAQIQS